LFYVVARVHNLWTLIPRYGHVSTLFPRYVLVLNVYDYDFEIAYWVVGTVGTKTELSLNTDDLYVEFSPIVDTIEDIGWALSEELC
jgi:hypothetical protein